MTITSVSSSFLSNALLPSIHHTQSQLATLETESASGEYADLGLQLGSQSGYEVSLRSEDDLLQSLTSANGIASTSLAVAQSALGTIASSAQSAATQVTSWLNSAGTPSQLQSLGESNLRQLTALANTNVSGQYVFAGINSGTAPLDDYFATSTSLAKSALDQSFQSTFGFPITSWQTSTISATQMQSFLSGPFASQFSSSSWSVWSTASSTNVSASIAPGQVVDTSANANSSGFQKLAEGYSMLSEFGNIGLSAGAQQALASSAVGLINGGATAIAGTEAQLGESQSKITQANASMGSQMTILQTQIGSLDSVDAASVATQLSALQTQLETAYQLTAQIQKLSLAQYIPT